MPTHDSVSPTPSSRRLRRAAPRWLVSFFALAFLATGAVLAVDVDLEIQTQLPTSLDQVSYRLAGVTVTTAGAAATTPITLSVAGLTPGSHTLSTSLGPLGLSIDAAGNVISNEPSRLAVSGTTLTILNTAGFPTLRVRGLEPTSMDGVQFRLRETVFLHHVGSPGTRRVAGSYLATVGVDYPFDGLLSGQIFQLLSSLGDVRFQIDAAGNLVPARPQDAGKFVVSGTTLTLQNTINIPLLSVRGAQSTSADQVTFRFRDSFFLEYVDTAADLVVPGADLASVGVAYAFEGMLRDQSFQLLTSLGDVRIQLDAAGAFVPSRPQDAGKFTFDGAELVLLNGLEHRLAVTAAQNSGLASVQHLLRTAFFNDFVGSETLPGTQLAEGVDFSLIGMAADQPLRLDSTVGSVVFELRADGSATFLSPAVQETPTRGSLSIEGGANTLYLELLPLNRAPEISIGSGTNLTLLSAEQAITVLQGDVFDPDGEALTCRWLEGATVLFGPLSVSSSCDLDLGTIPPLAIGDHTLVMEVSDGAATVTDAIVVTIENSPPVVAPSGGGVLQIGPLTEATLGGEVSDFDGDVLAYKWRQAGSVLFSGSVTPAFGGAPVALAPETVPTLDLGVGTFPFELAVSDGVNVEVARSIEIEVIDTDAPTLSPVPSRTILWPPNHRMVEVTVEANAEDNAGGTVMLTVEVTSSEPPEFDGDGNFVPDHEIVSVDAASGVIELLLRAERSGRGPGRSYTVVITATDQSGNSSTAEVVVHAPHNR